MKLYEMFIPFDTLSDTEQHEFVVQYRDARMKTIERHIASFSKKKKKGKKPKLSQDEKLLLKKLGITSLKSLTT